MEDAPFTVLLKAWAGGDESALERLTPAVYDELRRLAAPTCARSGPATRSARPSWSPRRSCASRRRAPGLRDRVHFFAMAARHMRRILVDHARKRTAAKRGGLDRPVTLDEGLIAADRPDALRGARRRAGGARRGGRAQGAGGGAPLLRRDEPKEIAAALSVHDNTVARDLRLAEAWLNRQMTPAE